MRDVLCRHFPVNLWKRHGLLFAQPRAGERQAGTSARDNGEKQSVERTRRSRNDARIGGAQKVCLEVCCAGSKIRWYWMGGGVDRLSPREKEWGELWALDVNKKFRGIPRWALARGDTTFWKVRSSADLACSVCARDTVFV